MPSGLRHAHQCCPWHWPWTSVARGSNEYATHAAAMTVVGPPVSDLWIWWLWRLSHISGSDSESETRHATADAWLPARPANFLFDFV